VTVKAETRLTSICCRKTSGVVSTIKPGAKEPCIVHEDVRRPPGLAHRLRHFGNGLVVRQVSRQNHRIGTAVGACLGDGLELLFIARHESELRVALEAKASAMARPMPWLAPVMTTTGIVSALESVCLEAPR
jgi:hypothetical protein